MATRKWGQGRWGTFRWAGSAAFYTLLAQATGVHIKRRIIWKLDAGDQNITQYFVSGGSVNREKERAPDRMTAGDMSLTFNNASGVFTERDSGTFLNGVNYHNRNVTFEVGVELPDGTTEWRKIATMKVRAIRFSTDNAHVTLQCYDLVSRLLTERVNERPAGMIPAFGGSNVGNGTITEIDTKPFKTKTENWTLTCTLGGGDSTATFSVVGSVSGNIGTATSGTEFSHASSTGGVKFTISAGGTNWAIDDTITFSTVQMMEWTATNPMKIIWSILTGTNYDTLANEDWKSRTPQLSSTQSSANTDIDWASFQKAVNDATDVLFTLTGYLLWDYNLADAIEEILFHFLGSMNIDGSGRIYPKIFRPEFDAQPTEFSDTKKNTSFSYSRDLRDMITQVAIRYRKRDIWPWTDEDEEETLDGLYVQTNTTSETAYGQSFGPDEPIISRWYNASGDHVTYQGTRIIDKYGQPPARIKCVTGIDALEKELGEIVMITDDKHGFTEYPVEVVGIDGDYADEPVRITLSLEDTGTVAIDWAFMGSSVDEGDGMSPQASSYDSASETDKYFAYLSQTGGSGSTGPDYYIF